MEETLRIEDKKVTLWDQTGTVASVLVGPDNDDNVKGDGFGVHASTGKKTKFSMRGEDGVQKNYWFPGDEAFVRAGNRVSLLCGKTTKSFLLWSRSKEDWVYLVNHDSREQWCFWKKPKDFVFSIGIVDKVTWWALLGIPALCAGLTLVHIQFVKDSDFLRVFGSSEVAAGLMSILGLICTVGVMIGREVKARSIWSEKLKPPLDLMAAKVLLGAPGLVKREIGKETVERDSPVTRPRDAGKIRIEEPRIEEETVKEEPLVSTESEEEEGGDLEVTPGKKMCLDCGEVNRAGAEFCGQCGNPI